MIDTRAIRAEVLRMREMSRATADQCDRVLEMLDADAEGVQVIGQGRVTRQMLADLWAESRHLPGVCALLDETAAHPNQVVRFSQVVSRSGLEDKKQSNDHARLTRNATRLFGKRLWPIEAWQGNGGEMQYRMGRTIAEWFNEIRSQG